MNKDPNVDPNTLNANSFRPIQGFSDFYMATNNGYANYNALQLAWARTKGRYTYALNYTFGKAMGITGYLTRPTWTTITAFCQATGPTFSTPHTPSIWGIRRRASSPEGCVNGWQLSGITQIQSGANLTGFSNQNFGLNANGYLNAAGYKVSNVSILGTNDIQLSPVLTCDPRKGLGSNQYINGSCFAIPTQIGQNGPTVLPAIYGPAFVNSDLALFKNFSFTESKKLQFRFNGYNFLNHPLWSFNGSNLGLASTARPAN